MNVQKLQELSKQTLGEAIFKTLAGRERPRRITDLRRLKQDLTEEGISVNTREFNLFFKALEAAGCGRLILPR
jgi:enterochelin esterase-like enzyme